MLPAVPATSNLSSDSSDSGHDDGRPCHSHHEEPFINMAECTSVHDGRQQISTILPVNIDTLFQSLYGRSKFLDEFHASRKITDVEHTEWALDEENRRRRRFKCVMPIKASIGPKFSNITEIQTLRECSVPGNLYSIDITSWNENVPYGDVFTIYVHHCLVRTVDDHTMFSVYVNIKFRKSVFSVIKNLIEKTSYSGMDEYHSDLALQLSRHFCTPPVRHKRHNTHRNRSSVQTALADTTTNLANRASTPPRIETSPIGHKKLSIQAQTNHHNRNHHNQPASNKFVFPPNTEHSTAPSCLAQSKKCAWFILFLLIAVSTVNVIMFLHLISIKELDSREAWLNSLRWDDTSNFSSDDWIRILETRELLHRRKLRAMKQSLIGSITTIKQTEHQLLQMAAILSTPTQTHQTSSNLYGSDTESTKVAKQIEQIEEKTTSTTTTSNDEL